MKNDLVIRIGAVVSGFKEATSKINKFSKDIIQQGKKLGLAVGAAVGGAVFAYQRYEANLINVGKTTGITGKTLENFGKQVRQLSKEIPVATNELLEIAQAAGQLGVKGEKDLLKVTTAVAKLTRSTNLGASEAAISLTRILDLTSQGVDNIDKFGSVLVRLGNNFAVNEAEITNFSLSLASGIARFGVSAQDIAAFSTALAASGVQAENARTQFAKAFQSIVENVEMGSEGIEVLSAVTGVAKEELKATFNEDRVKFMERFVQGLSGLDEITLKEVLKQLNLDGERGVQVFGALSQNVETFSDALGQARDEYRTNTALSTEFEAQTKSLASQFQLVSSRVNDLFVRFGSKLAPITEKVTEKFINFLDSITDKQLEEGANLVGRFVEGMVAVAEATIDVLSALKPLNSFISGTFNTALGVLKTALFAVLTPLQAIANIFSFVTGKGTEFTNSINKIQSDLFSSANKNLSKGREQYGEGFGNIFGGGQSTPQGGMSLPEDAPNQSTPADAPNQSFPEDGQEQAQIAGTAFPTDANGNIDQNATLSDVQLALKEQRDKEQADKDQEKKDEALEREIEHLQNLQNENKSTLQGMLSNWLGFFDTRHQNNLKDKKRALLAEREFGQNVAAVMDFLATKNKKLAIAFAIVKTASGVSRALSDYPFPASVAVGASVLAAGAVQIAKIRSQKFARGGGIMKGGTPGVDSINATYMPGELVAPVKNFDEVIDSVAKSRGYASPEQNMASGIGGILEIRLKRDAAKFIDYEFKKNINAGVQS